MKGRSSSFNGFFYNMKPFQNTISIVVKLEAWNIHQFIVKIHIRMSLLRKTHAYCVVKTLKRRKQKSFLSGDNIGSAGTSAPNFKAFLNRNWITKEQYRYKEKRNKRLKSARKKQILGTNFLNTYILSKQKRKYTVQICCKLIRYLLCEIKKPEKVNFVWIENTTWIKIF